MKFDLRAFTYDGAVQWVAARLYQGQTTNFRTPGGGFAPVYSAVDVPARTSKVCADNGPKEVEHASYVFLLDDGSGIHPVPHALYVALARGQATAPALAGQTLRLADWYVRLKEGAPDTIANETYYRVRFDAQGRVDWTTSQASLPQTTALTTPDDTGWPTAAERERMLELLFGATEGTESPSPPSSTVPSAETPSHCSKRLPGTGEAPCR